jgi:SARP family transcriptional regulator, regulator of embCAB operon
MMRPQAVSVRHATGAQVFRLSLLGGFGLRVGGKEHSLASGSCRLVALLALSGQPMQRPSAAGILWPEATDARACACLRSALARLGCVRDHLLRVTATELSLGQAVRVDLREAQACARRLLAGDRPLSRADRYGHSEELLSLELLPGWYEDWVLLQAEAWRQFRLHALEALSARLSAEDCHAGAVSAALTAVSADPLRESARSVLIRAYLAESNRSEALREFETYRQLLRRALGVEPTARLHGLVCAATRAPGLSGAMRMNLHMASSASAHAAN